MNFENEVNDDDVKPTKGRNAEDSQYSKTNQYKINDQERANRTSDGNSHHRPDERLTKNKDYKRDEKIDLNDAPSDQRI